jgi:RHS repeat-associated protein
LGSVRDVVDGNGAVVNHLVYDSFGNIESESNGAIDFRFGYTGREFDAESGQYYYRARYYDAGVGRFLSEDPISFSGGDANLYRYVSNGSPNLIDPDGYRFTRPTYRFPPRPTTRPGTGSSGGTGGSYPRGLDFSGPSLIPAPRPYGSPGNPFQIPVAPGVDIPSLRPRYAEETPFPIVPPPRLQPTGKESKAFAPGSRFKEFDKAEDPGTCKKCPYGPADVPTFYENGALYPNHARMVSAALTIQPGWANLNYRRTFNSVSKGSYRTGSQKYWKDTYGEATGYGAFNWDEYPYASTYQGGSFSGAYAELVPSQENQGAGNALLSFYHNTRREARERGYKFGDGCPFRVIVINVSPNAKISRPFGDKIYDQAYN